MLPVASRSLERVAKRERRCDSADMAITSTNERSTAVSRCWLFSADPTDYHWDTLFVKGKELWAGIRSAKAQRYLKQIRKGDRVLCYHMAPERVVYAVASVASDPYPDPYARDGKLLAVDLKAVYRLPRVVPYKELKLNRALRRMRFLSDPRLAVSPLSEDAYNEILRMAGVPVAVSP